MWPPFSSCLDTASGVIAEEMKRKRSPKKLVLFNSVCMGLWAICGTKRAKRGGREMADKDYDETV
jgi:hypothetical protein